MNRKTSQRKSTSPSRRSRGFPPADTSTDRSAAAPAQVSNKPPVRWNLVILFLVISIGGTYFAIAMRPRLEAPRFTYRVLETYKHDELAFTQGLIFDDGFLWESTGRYGESTIRKTDLKTGEVLEVAPLEDTYFGEGLTILDDRLYQLTWKEGTMFVYDRQLKERNRFRYPGEGWGLTTDGTSLIFSDGSREILFLDPETLDERKSIWVRQPSGAHVGQLNELEYYQGKIYANRYQSDLIYEIDPVTGMVTKVIDLQGLWKDRPADGVLNGIAVNPESRKLLVTGKLCPYVWELSLVPED